MRAPSDQMNPRPDHGARSLLSEPVRAALFVGFVILLALTAVSLHPGSPSAATAGNGGLGFDATQHVQSLRFGLLAVCSVLVVVRGLLRRRPSTETDEARARALRRLFLMAALLIVALLVADALIVSLLGSSLPSSIAAAPRPALVATVTAMPFVAPTAAPVPTPFSPTVQNASLGGMRWLTPVLIFAACLLVAVVAALAWRWRQVTVTRLPFTPPAPQPALPPAPALDGALDEGIEALQAEPDPRRAVIAAYAGMERSLTDQGWRRRPSEAPFEYLRRLLPSAAVDRTAAAQLTELFETARFSDHPVLPAVKDAALQALLRIRADLDQRTTEASDRGS